MSVVDQWMRRRNRELKYRKCYGDQFVIFIDWRSAFDRVHHELMLQIIKDMGMSQRNQRIIEIVLQNSNSSLDGVNFEEVQIGAP